MGRMDRPTHRLEPRRRAPLRLNALNWWIYGLVVLCAFAGRALYCSGNDFRQCMRDGMPGIAGVLLQAGALVLAVWEGSGIGRRHSNGLGLAAGTAIFLGLMGFLAWLGILPRQQ